jgi:signal transduction histidine kinase
MNVRTRLTLLFTVVVASILGLFSLAVYYSSAQYRENEFYTRLKDKARTTARLLIEVDEVDANLLKIIDRNNLTSLPREQIIVYNYLNQIVYDSDDNPLEQPASKDFLDRIRLEGEVHYTEGAKEVVGLVVNHAYDRYVVIASALDQYGLSKLNNLRLVLIFGFTASLAMVAFAGWFFAGRAMRPISDIVDQTSRITATNLSTRLSEGNGKDEIARLAVTFNAMLDRLQKAFDAQRSFVSNASHELRTPLTIITGQIEVMLIRRRSAEEYEDRMKSILTDITRLNKLSNGLLELAQVSADSANIRLQQVQIDDIIYQCALTLSNKYVHYHTSFAFEETGEFSQSGFNVLGDEALLKTAFMNLMENACKFSPDHQVQVTLGEESNQLKIRFTDGGIGIDTADLEHIFQPFFRAENAKKIGGHGIGLSLTKRIIELHQGQIAVTSQPDQGTTFTVWLPGMN